MHAYIQGLNSAQALVSQSLNIFLSIAGMAFVIPNLRRRLLRKSAPPPWCAPAAGHVGGLGEELKALLEEVGAEVVGNPRDVYLVTISRVLPDGGHRPGVADLTTMTSQQIGDAVRLALDFPRPPGYRGGRPPARAEGLVQKLVAFRELHADGTPHFHVAVKLRQAVRWASTKATLKERSGLPSHWSSSHTQFWSAVRYGFMPSEKKPVVDASPYQWVPVDAAALNLSEESQRPFSADLWKRRREQAERSGQVGPTGKKRRFCKLDLTSIIMAAGLDTPSQVMDHVQQRGTEEMQLWTNRNQEQLPKIVADAKAWAAASDDAARERQSDWELLCSVAGTKCTHGGGGRCSWAQAAGAFFEGNKHVLDKEALAAALRSVIMSGPTKVTRVPLIVGPTNTAKSTIVLPFDQLYGKSRVFHKPAITSSFPLANIRKRKRFLFWDDYRPIQYAQATIHVSTYLSMFQGEPFEVALSGAFNDGNEDFTWNRGAVMTAKADGLWESRGAVTAEDVRHMQSRHLVFRAEAELPSMRGVQQCAPHMCMWIKDSAARFDARQVVRPYLAEGVPLVAARSAAGCNGELISGMDRLQEQSRVSMAGAIALSHELRGLGAIHVREVAVGEWERLTAWHNLMPFEQRRFMSVAREFAS